MFSFFRKKIKKPRKKTIIKVLKKKRPISKRIRLPRGNYARSNAILTTDFPISRKSIQLTRLLLTKPRSAKNRQVLSEKLLNELATLAKVSPVKLKISSTNQYHSKKGGKVVFKQYGYYKPGSKYIYITNKTAVRGQILAPKSFVDTLIHEWMHHYDHEKLKLDSIHTSGFYSRLKDLKEKLGYFADISTGKKR